MKGRCDICGEPLEAKSATFVLVSGYVTPRRGGGVHALALRREHPDHQAHDDCVFLARHGVASSQAQLEL